MPKKKTSVRQSVTIPARLAREVRRVAKERNVTMSRALVTLAERGVEATAPKAFYEVPALYDVARKICHDFGLPWTDPRTGITYEPPKTANAN